MNRSFKLAAILVFATFALAACGKRGALEPPVTSDSGNTPQTKTDEKVHRPNPLDGLLR